MARRWPLLPASGQRPTLWVPLARFTVYPNDLVIEPKHADVELCPKIATNLFAVVNGF